MEWLKQFILMLKDPQWVVRLLTPEFPTVGDFKYLKITYYVVLGVVSLLFFYLAFKLLRFMFRKLGQLLSSIRALWLKKKPVPLPTKKTPSELWNMLKGLFQLLSPASKSNIDTIFEELQKRMRGVFGGSDYMYSIPFYVQLSVSRNENKQLWNRTKINRLFTLDSGKKLDIAITALEKMVVLDWETKDSKLLESMLTQLLYIRPRRPLDGIILTLSVDDLKNPNLFSRIEAIFQDLVQTHRVTTLKLPVYVLVTDLNSVLGFETLSRFIHASEKQRPFGWSNIYGMEVPYNSLWMEDAKASSLEAMNDIKMRLFSGASQSLDFELSAELFMCVEEFKQLWEPLSNAMNRLFSTGPAFHDSVSLRGLYFCAADVFHKDSTSFFNDHKPLLFLDNVLSDKIVKERSLAYPVANLAQLSKLYFSKDKITLISLLGVSFVCMLGSYSQMQHQKQLFVPVLFELKAALVSDESTQDSSKAINLFYNAAYVADRDLSYWKIFMPSSWFANYKDDVYRNIGRIFAKLFLTKMPDSIHQKLEKLLNLGDGSDLMRKTVSVSDLVAKNTLLEANPIYTKEFQTLTAFTKDLIKVERATASYHRFLWDGDPENLFSALSNLYGEEIPESIRSNFQYYRDVIPTLNLSKVEIDNYKDKLQSNFDVLFAQFVSGGLKDNIALKKIFNAPSWIDAIPTLGITGSAKLTQFDTLVNQLKYMVDVSTDNIALTWLQKPKFDPGEDFSNFKGSVLESEILSKTSLDKNMQQLEAAYIQTKDSMSKINSQFLRGPVLSFSDFGLTLNPVLVSIYKNIDAFINEPFLKALSTDDTDGKKHAPSDDKLFLWDDTQLQATAALLDSYKKFAAEKLGDYDSKIRSVLGRFAKIKACQNLLSGLQGAIFEVKVPSSYVGSVEKPEEKIKEISKNLTNNAAQLQQILAQVAASDVEGSELESEWKSIISVLKGNITKVLSVLDSIVDKEHNLSVQDSTFQFWNGEKNPIVVGFSVQNSGDLNSVLEQQAGRISNLATEHAASAVDLLRSNLFLLTEDETKALKKWGSIVDQSVSYGKKQAGNTLSSLLLLYQSDLKDVGDEKNNDQKTLDGLFASIQDSSDYFVSLRNTVIKNLKQRLEVIQGVRVRDHYKEIQTAFNQKLSGKYPFVGGNGENAKTLDPKALKEFYTLVDKKPYSLDDYKTALNKDYDSVSNFLECLFSLKKLLNPFLSGKKDVPEVSVQVFFDAGQERASDNARNLIDQEMRFSGDANLTRMESGKKITWSFGEPIKISFSVARASGLQIADSDSSNFSKQDDASGSFSFGSAWSLFTMLSKMQDQNDKEMCKFSIPALESGRSTSIRTFIRFVLQSTDADNPYTLFSLPKVPDQAPDLSVSN